MSLVEKLKKNKFIFEIGVHAKVIWFNHIVDTIDLCKVKLRQLGILKESKYNYIRSFKDKYKGKRCFIIATGPSLTIEDVNALKGEYTFGVNAVVKLLDQMTYIPTFLGIQDHLVYDKIGDIIEKSPLKHIFVSDSLYRKKVRNKDSERFVRFPLYSCGHAVHAERYPFKTFFSDDVSNVVYTGNSIAYSVLQIAVYMGFEEIYLLGCDCNYDTKGKQYFVESGHFDKYASSAGERMIMAFDVANQHLKKNKPNVKVYNATRGGMLEVFPRKTLDEVFEK